LAAVDGSTATDWSPAKVPATLTAPVRRGHPVRRAVLVWGRQWPPAPKPNVHPPPRPVIDRRATRYVLLVSSDGRHWRRLVEVRFRHGTTDTIQFPALRARFVRIRITAAADKQPPLLQELRVTG
jgi:hypothetical protein